MAAPAEINRSELPSKVRVKTLLDGSGKWFRGVGDPNFVALGADPSQCRSDLPFAGAIESRSASYQGPVRHRRRYFGLADVTLYRYASPELASQAIARAGTFAAACPSSEEWVCEQCDGIWTYRRQPAAPRAVGEEAVAWNQRSASLGTARGHVIAARAGTVVVVVFVANATDPEITKYPKSANWSRTEAVARAALASAAGTS